MSDKATKNVSSGSTGLQSMQSLGWGAVAMQQLGQLINWSGSDSFTPVSVDPWTALSTFAESDVERPSQAVQEASPISAATASAPLSPTDASPEEPAAQRECEEADKVAADTVTADKAAADKAVADKAVADKVAADKAAAETVAADKAAADKAAAEKAAADKAAADKAAAETVAADKAAADKAAADKAVADKAVADKAVADKAVADKAAADKAAADNAAADKVAADKAAADKVAADKVAADKAAADKAAADKVAADKVAADKVAADKAAADKVAADKVAAEIDARKQQSIPRPEVEPSRPARDDGPRMQSAVSTPVYREVRTATPRQLEPIAAATTVPAPVLQRPVSADSSVEDYLLRLEQLVLQLNMELGRRNPASHDPIQDLSQRVIDLNLENLALKEQLRQSTGKHHE